MASEETIQVPKGAWDTLKALFTGGQQETQEQGQEEKPDPRDETIRELQAKLAALQEEKPDPRDEAIKELQAKVEAATQTRISSVGRPPAGGGSRNSVDIASMTLEERSKFAREVMYPADLSGRPV